MPLSKGVGLGGVGGVGGGSADNLLANLKAMEARAASIRSSASRSRMGSYQSMRAVSASLEDSLGYLP